MKYNHIVSGTFLQRPNRFIAHVRINGKEEICHVKNTGRCRELLVPGCTVYCSVSDNPQRKTKYDLIAVEKIVESYATSVCKKSQSGFASKEASASNSKRNTKSGNTLLVNMDSQAPNAAVKEWLASGASPFGKISYMKPEYKFSNSRFDFYLECKNKMQTPACFATNHSKTNHNATRLNIISPSPTQKTETKLRKIFLEVKGVTLEDNGVVLFPDAPTERGVKHVRELIQCHAEGFETYGLFVVQMERALYFTPNRKTHPQFADALCEAQNAGVQLLAYTCKVSPDEMKIDKELKISL